MPHAVSHVALEALAFEQQRIERIAHHVANLQTPGFRPSSVLVTSTEFAAALERAPTAPRDVASVPASAAAGGTLRPTGRALDIALSSPGWLEVATPLGPAYTRRGDLRLDGAGRLVDHAGRPVMGQAGPIVLAGDTPRIDAAGRIREGVGAADREVARLRVVEIEAGGLREAGAGLWQSSGTVRELEEGRIDVRQAHLESSAVDLGREMVQLTRSVRHVETLLRLVQLRGEVGANAVRALGGNPP